MKIIQLKAENVKRIKAVEITPDKDGNLVVISGKNSQGKTSVLDSIMFALASARKIQDKPIREGTDKAEISLDLGDMVVERTITPKGSYLKVKNKDGFEQPGPQALLDKLVGTLSFDPLDFTKMEPEKQVRVLKDITGLDFKALDKERTDAYDTRTLLNRQMATLKAQVEALPAAQGLPEAEVKISDLTQAYRAAVAGKDENERQRKILDTMRADLDQQKKTLMALHEQAKAVEARIEDIKKAGKEQAAKVATLQDPDIEAINKQIAEAEQVNAMVRKQNERKEIINQAMALQGDIDLFTRKIEKCDKAKESAISTARMPIPGLGFGDKGITFKGIPFTQLSSSEQLKISLAISIVLNPQLRVILIRDGSLLDARNFQVIGEMAKAHDFQVWVEKVDDEGKVGIIIEDGMVKGGKDAS